jgi:hypothetical protein
LFDRDCAYIWHSKNPVNGLVYGYGGVKLFSRKIFMKTKHWKTLDMSTSIMPKLKVIDTVSNITAFNTNAFSTWRSAFRECVKLYASDQPSKIDTWINKGANKPYGNYAIHGAQSGRKFAECNAGNLKELSKINDYNWLNSIFKKIKLE